MALTDYADPYADIPAGNTTIRVYGLNLESIGRLQQKHGQAFLDAVTSFKGFFGSGDPKSVEYAIVALVCQMADLVAVAIALGAREPGHADAATGGISGLRPDEVPAILRKGEEVLTANDPRHRSNGGGAMGGGQPKVDLKIVNAIDPGEMVSEGLTTTAGQQAFLNFVRSNKRAFRQATS